MPTFEWSDDEVNDADSESDSSYLLDGLDGPSMRLE